MPPPLCSVRPWPGATPLGVPPPPLLNPGYATGPGDVESEDPTVLSDSVDHGTVRQVMFIQGSLPAH